MSDVHSLLLPLARDAQTYLRKRHRTLKVDPVALVNSAEAACSSLRSSRFNLVSGTAYRLDKALKEAAAAISSCLGRPGSTIMPFTLNMQRPRSLPSSYTQQPDLTVKEKTKFQNKIGGKTGLRFDDTLYNRHGVGLSQKMSAMFPGQSTYQDLSSAMNKDYSGLENAILTLFGKSKWDKQRSALSAAVWLSITYLYGYAVIGDKVGYDEVEPMVKLFASDEAVAPISNRDTDPIDTMRWIVIVE